MLDILGMQQLYGLPASKTFSGGQTFGFNSNISDAAAPFFDFTHNVDPVVTIWDSGTDNTLDLSGFFTPSYVDLNPGTFSDADGMINNIGIAYNTRIDTAIGGGGNDTFIVNSDSDTIDGGGGSNTVMFPNAYADYVITALGNGHYSVSDGATTDDVTNIQTLAFADQASSLPPCPPETHSSWTVGNGSYSDKANWTDVTTGKPATSPPGATDLALLTGPTSGGPQTISGNGDAAQMVFTGMSGVTGSLTPGLLTIGQGGGQSATLTIAPGATIDATSAALRTVPQRHRHIGNSRCPDRCTGRQHRHGESAGADRRNRRGRRAGHERRHGRRGLDLGLRGRLCRQGCQRRPDDRPRFGGKRQRNVADCRGQRHHRRLRRKSRHRLTRWHSGQVTIAAASTLTLSDDTTVPISFADATGTLAVTASSSSALSLDEINNFVAGDAISITALTAKSQPAALLQPTYDAVTGAFTVPFAGGGIAVEGTLDRRL